MLRKQRLALYVSRSAVRPLRMSTDATPAKMSRPDTSDSLETMPSGVTLQSSSDRTWNATHGITFQKNTSGPRASDHLRKLPSQGIPSQKDAWPLTELQTQHPVSQDEDREGLANVVLSESPTHLLEPQLECATTSSNSNDHELSSESAHSEDCLSSDHETFRTPLGYHIPDSKLRSAMLAEPSTAASYWHFSLYQGPGGDKDKVKVHYSRNRETTEKIAQLFVSEEVLGFDIEWKASSTARDGLLNNVSLIQIASEERVLLAHIAQYPNATISAKAQRTDDFVGPSLKKIMESPSINKVGVGIKADCTRMRKYLKIQSQGLFELSHLYRLVKYSSSDIDRLSKKLVSLAQQVEEHLKLPLEKGDVRTSDWSHQLNYEQTQYAASDSYAALQLYHILEAKRRTLEPSPPRPAHAELNLPIRSVNGQTVVSSDEALDLVEDTVTDARSRRSDSVDELAQDFRAAAIKEPTSYPRIPSHTPPPSKSPPATPSKPEPTPEIVAANTWVTEYLKSHPAATARKTNLRAYYLWAGGKERSCMEPDAIADLLWIGTSTVATYVLLAIKCEGFAFDERRTRALVPHVVLRWMRDDFNAMISRRVKKRDSAARLKEGVSSVRRV